MLIERDVLTIADYLVSVFARPAAQCPLEEACGRDLTVCRLLPCLPLSTKASQLVACGATYSFVVVNK